LALELGQRARCDAIKFACVVEHRLVAANPHIARIARTASCTADPAARVARQRASSASNPASRVARRRSFIARRPSKGVDQRLQRGSLVLSAAWLTINRADTGMISSTGTRAVGAQGVCRWKRDRRSHRARPTSGAELHRPVQANQVECTPFAAKCSR